MKHENQPYMGKAGQLSECLFDRKPAVDLKVGGSTWGQARLFRDRKLFLEAGTDVSDWCEGVFHIIL
jgi:hypothetical protein